MGQFIVIEGGDKVGKSFLISNLSLRLKNCITVKFPNRLNFSGKIIDSHLRKENIITSPLAIHYLFIANRAEEHQNLEELIKNNDFVLADRYSLSNSIYTFSKNPTDFGLSNKEELKNLAFLPEFGPKPFLQIILIENQVEKLENRGDFGNEIFEKIEFQRKVNENFQNYALNHSENVILLKSFEYDIETLIEEIHARCQVFNL